MNPPLINSSSSVSTTRKKREAERSLNWTVEETQVLLCVWSNERVQKSLAENLRNRHVFKHLATRMSEMGFSRSPHQCRLRVKTLKANYVRAKLQRSVDAAQPCTFKYFDEMDAVLGRRSAGGEAGCAVVTPDHTGGLHLSSSSRTGSTPQDSNSNLEISGHHFGSSRKTGNHLSGSLEERGGRQSWRLDSGVKVEDGEVSTDETEFSDQGFHPLERDGREDYRESASHLDMNGPLVEPPPPPPCVRSASPPPPAPSDPHPNSLPTSTHHPLESPCVEPVLGQLSDCFRGLVSETRGLLVQLESQRQEQARWHQELLHQWLQREERRQREAAEREERREKARMEHEIRVLELLTGLAKETRCRCRDGPSAAEDV